MPRIGIVAVVALSTFVVALGSAQAEDELKNKNTGGGAVAGFVDVTSEAGIPPVNELCAPAAFDFSGRAPSFVLNTVITGYVGAIDFHGSGTTTCSGPTGTTGGFLDVIAEGVGPTGSELDCSVSGSFTRLGTVIQAPTLTGTCTVNQFGTGPVSFAALLTVTPLPNDPPTGVPGVTEPTRHATFTGAFTISPVLFE